MTKGSKYSCAFSRNQKYNTIIFEKLQKKFKIEVTNQKRHNFERFQSNLTKTMFSGPVSIMKFCLARTFLVELHLDDVLEVLLVVDFFV